MATKKKKEAKDKFVKSQFYQKLLKEKSIIESQLVFSLFSDPESLLDYELSLDDFSNQTWKFYFFILKELVEKRQLKVMDSVSVTAYIQSKGDSFTAAYETRGGYETIERGMEIVESDNIDSYFNELQRYKTLLKLTEYGFPIEEKWNSVQKMSLEMLDDYLEGLVAQAFVNSQMGGDRVEDMFADVDAMLNEADKGIARGLPLASPLMDSIQNGLALGNITMLGANSGVGKTFLTTLLHIISCIKEEEQLLIIANEEEKSRYVQGLLAARINKQHQDANFNKNRFINGGFSDQEWQWLNEAKEWYVNKVQGELINFINMNDFSMSKTIKLIKKYARMHGVKYFILDTLKLDNDAGSRITDNSWLQLQQNMVKLYNTIKPSNLNVHIWITAQMSKTNRRSRYLDQSMLGISKNITDVVSSLMLTRMVSQSEKEGSTALKVINSDGYSVQLDPEQDYMLVFWDKNRQGATNRQVVLAVDRGLNLIRDIGWTQIDNDLE
ncbi:replication protein [Limosilactobacillus reuteri]|uniref:Replication protein n=1 Tax=Limosilactobacillus reuteri TaxID=1598 RepID=A0ABD6Y6B5_LIMRT|nr:DnaB-like helicase C-terminal domain-containing protein [Limosilactobacillus reuteri]PWT35099.1 replication protein [Limosilactobacillus reuteri]PWT37208.1 replication protein [Limosilactobacillus reuteri]PWT57598.1 replication protein [Limosilactobacillus reuteri]PWT59956.1 replication protein [Limosilactobacillus reuteri]PWT66540.1 replication protein [Limosilactobacillus reuteri]